ncbi:MAG: hypothetical protein HPY80_03815 [Bacteroidales bacterium]|nr:hypothetical protein [Bacteroidales bacterium]NPV35782.1 hypothetical protein [Bacteroidales bacterium]
MKITCPSFKYWYPRLKSGKLAANDEQLAINHLSTCEKCRKAANAIEALIEDKIQPESDVFFSARLFARLEKSKPSHSVFIFRPVFAYTLLLSLSLFLGIRLGTYFYYQSSIPSENISISEEYAIHSTISGLDVFFQDDFNE